jgi:hypothetical protein
VGPDAGGRDAGEIGAHEPPVRRDVHDRERQDDDADQKPRVRSLGDALHAHFLLWMVLTLRKRKKNVMLAK